MKHPLARMLICVGIAITLTNVVITTRAVTTNTLDFSSTLVTQGAGPVSPSSGPESISGASLKVGDIVVLDTIVIDEPGSGADAWGAVELNAGSGFLGIINASFGVLVETGTNNNNVMQLFVNGASTNMPFGLAVNNSQTNLVHIMLTCTQAGSTTNMNYLVAIDQGATGVYSASLAGTAITFGGNSITLSFGAQNEPHLFIQSGPIHSKPGIVTFDFPTTTVAAVPGGITDPGISINGNELMVGGVVVFDGIIVPNGAQVFDSWTSVNIGGSGYGNVTDAQLGLLCRMATGQLPSELWIDGITNTDPTAGSALTNRVRIELYPSANGSTTNMGWLVEIDQNLSGNFKPAVTGTNLTFANNVLQLTFGSAGSSSMVYQNPQSPVSIFTGPNPVSQVVSVGSPIMVGVTVEGWSPTFQWFKNGFAIPNATNENYTSPSATLADNNDQFYVVVSNQLNYLNVVTSMVANVVVLIPNTLTWYPEADFTTWDTTTANWTTNNGVSQCNFVSGDNVVFDNLGFVWANLAHSVDLENNVTAGTVMVNVSSDNDYSFSGYGSLSGQSLLVSGDGTGQLLLENPSVSFSSVTISAFEGSSEINTTLRVGYGGTNCTFAADYITNNGVLEFNNDAGVLPVPGLICGTGSIIQNGTGTTVLSGTNSIYCIQAINFGTLSIACTPNPGIITNNSVLEIASPADLVVIPNAMVGGGYYNFFGFQTTIVTGHSSHTGQNLLNFSRVVVDNPDALGDPVAGSSLIFEGGLYLSNNIVWSQPLVIDAATNSYTQAHISNFCGTNEVVSPLVLSGGTATGGYGSEVNVEAGTGLLEINSRSSLINGDGAINLNLQGSGTGIWNGPLIDGNVSLNVLMRGTGNWTLGGSNSYSGSTTIANGTLFINGVTGAGNVIVRPGATLGGSGFICGSVIVAPGANIEVNPGLGVSTLTVSNNLILNPGSFVNLRINKATGVSDKITGVTTLTYGGTLMISNLAGVLTTNDIFTLFSAKTYMGAFVGIKPTIPGEGLVWNTNTLSVDGTLRIAVAAGPATNPTNITVGVVGNTLTLTWPVDHIGWRLLVQTNQLAGGISSNSNDWSTVAGSTELDQISLDIDPLKPSEFYRLVYP